MNQIRIYYILNKIKKLKIFAKCEGCARKVSSNYKNFIISIEDIIIIIIIIYEENVFLEFTLKI